MTIKSIFLGGFICASVLVAADAFAVFEPTVRCDAYTSATNVALPPRRADRKMGGDDKRARRMRSKPKGEEAQLHGDSAVLTTRRANLADVDSTVVDVHKK